MAPPASAFIRQSSRRSTTTGPRSVSRNSYATRKDCVFSFQSVCSPAATIQNPVAWPANKLSESALCRELCWSLPVSRAGGSLMCTRSEQAVKLCDAETCELRLLEVLLRSPARPHSRGHSVAAKCEQHKEFQEFTVFAKPIQAEI